MSVVGVPDLHFNKSMPGKCKNIMTETWRFYG